MAQKLFTKDIEKKLVSQYKFGSDLSKQDVVAKIFNPYGLGNWYLINQDPNDLDYIYAIVDWLDLEVGSVSRTELINLRVPPFGLPLERDIYFSPINAEYLYQQLVGTKKSATEFARGGKIGAIAIESKPTFSPQIVFSGFERQVNKVNIIE